MAPTPGEYGFRRSGALEKPVDHRIGRDRVVYSMDRSHPAVLHIDPGERVLVETFDARSGTVTRDEDLLRKPHPLGSNPATGPILIRGAERGDRLCVTIERIDLADSGFLAVKAGDGLLGHMASEFATRIVEIRGDTAVFDAGIEFPIRPMVGVIGTAPAGEPVGTGFPGPHGGNMDNRYATAGAKVYLPVQVPGALLALGDVHAAMGDGEISFLGLEICAEVTIQVELLKDAELDRPLIETGEYWVTTGDHEDLGEAARIAAEQMVALMQERGGMDFATAYMLMSGAVDVQICQCCEPGAFPVTTRAVVSKSLLAGSSTE